MNRIAGSGIFLLSLLLASCSSPRSIAPAPDQGPEISAFYAVNPSLERDHSLEVLLDPYRRAMENRLNRTVAVASGPLRYGKPESPLGNLAADMVRYRAAHEMERYVHIALLDPALLRSELSEGDITVGHLYDLLPANEMLTVLEMEGRHIRILADEIAATGGVPLSGMRMVINGVSASGVVIDYGALDEEQTYYLATGHSLVASGRFPSLGNYSDRTDHDLLIRELMADYLRSHRVIEPFEDLRVRIR